MTETAEQPVGQVDAEQNEPCICESYARATERAALAAARWLGRADQQAAEEAATSGMTLALGELPMAGARRLRPQAGQRRAWERSCRGHEQPL